MLVQAKGAAVATLTATGVIVWTGFTPPTQRFLRAASTWLDRIPDAPGVAPMTIARRLAELQAVKIGPAGPMGPPGGGVAAKQIVFGQPAVRGAPLFLSRLNGKAYLADCSSVTSSIVLGVAGSDQLAGFTADIVTGPVASSDWTSVTGTLLLSPGAIYFLGLNGSLTQQPPATPNALIEVGVAVDPHTLNVRPGTPIQL